MSALERVTYKAGAETGLVQPVLDDVPDDHVNDEDDEGDHGGEEGKNGHHDGGEPGSGGDSDQTHEEGQEGEEAGNGVQDQGVGQVVNGRGVDVDVPAVSMGRECACDV